MFDRRMDAEKTAPFELGSGENACLLIHGFTGTPWDVRPLGEAIAGRGFFVKGIRLPGHGISPEAMVAVNHRDWEQAAEEGLAQLSSYRSVFVCGLSMGALLSVLLAARYPDRVRGGVFMAPAVKFLDRQMAALKLLRALPIAGILKPWVLKDTTDIEDPVARAAAPVLPAFPTARLADVWALQEKVISEMGRVRCPCLVVHAKNDHVVAGSGAKRLQRGLTRASSVKMLELREGAHILPRDRGSKTLEREVGAFLEKTGGH